MLGEVGGQVQGHISVLCRAACVLAAGSARLLSQQQGLWKGWLEVHQQRAGYLVDHQGEVWCEGSSVEKEPSNEMRGGRRVRGMQKPVGRR